MSALAYEVHVAGELSETDVAELRAEVGELYVTTEPVRTLITGHVSDQAALVGLLDQLHALGLKVWELRRIPEPEAALEKPPG